MADYLGEVEASCYVLDCLWNMSSVYPTPDDDDLRATLVARGRRQVEQFGWPSAARALLEAYTSLAG